MCTVKKELESEWDYEVLNRYSADRLLNQIYARHQQKERPGPQPAPSSSGDTVMFITIHDELAKLRTQINHLQQTVEQLPERICDLLQNKQIQQSSSSMEQYDSARQQLKLTLPNVTKMEHDDADDDDGFDKLSSTSILSDIEILNESIEDNNRELLAWCRRLQINDITNHITVEPKTHPQLSAAIDDKPAPVEGRCESHIYSHWEKRYSSLSDHIKPAIVDGSNQSDTNSVPKLIPNYSSEIDKTIWLK